MRGRPTDHSERYAEAIVERVLGTAVEHVDDGRAQGEVDALIQYSDGSLGALEITRMGDPSGFELIATLEREGWRWPSTGAWSWMLNVKHLRELSRLRVVVPRAIALCESHGVTSPDALPPQLLFADADLRWLAWEQEGGLRGDPKYSSLAGWVLLTVSGGGAVIPPTWDGFEDEVASLLASENGERHVAKLRRRQGVVTRHLFLVLADDAVPLGFYLKLLRATDAPRIPLVLPHGIDTVWVASGMGATLRYDHLEGWDVSELAPEPPDVPAD